MPRSRPFDSAEAERQRLRRANMTPEQIEKQRERQREYSKTRRVRPEGHKYNRQHRRRMMILNPNHASMQVKLGQLAYHKIADQFRELQKGLCAICGKPETEEGRGFALDHDHETLMLRGLLCFSCNGKLGWFEANAEAVINYLEWSDDLS